MDRKKQYKKHLHSATTIKNRLKLRSAASQKEKREKLLSRKRARYEQVRESMSEEEYNITADQVKSAARKLLENTDGRLESLKTVRNGFTQGSALVDAFISVEGAMAALVALIGGSDAALKLEAAWCVNNMAANTDQHALHALELAGPALIANLTDASQELVDVCAWALGNMAGSEEECRALLMTQGVVAPLIELLKSDDNNVLRSAAFALSNLARDNKERPAALVSAGVFPLLLQKISFDSARDKMRCLAEVLWVVTYISATGEFEDELVTSGLLERCVQVLHEITEHNLSHYHLITPLMRTLGNIMACSHSAETIAQACAHNDFLPCLVKCLHKDHPNINKEALWVLSNVTTSQAACQQLVDKQLLSPIIQQIHGLLECRIEAAYSLVNMAHFGAVFCAQLLKDQVLSGVVDLLTCPEQEAVKLGLTLIELVLSHADESSLNDAKQQFDSTPKAMEAFEQLEYHTDPEIQTLASGILQKYFYLEEDPLKGEKGQGDANGDTAIDLTI